MQKLEIVHLFVGKKYVVLATIFCFTNLKVKDTKYRTTDSYSAHPKLCKNKWITNYILYAKQSSMLQISVHVEYRHFHHRLLFSHIKKIYQDL